MTKKYVLKLTGEERAELVQVAKKANSVAWKVSSQQSDRADLTVRLRQLNDPSSTLQ